MRIIQSDEITKTIKQMCMDANYYLNEDIEETLKAFRAKETNELPKNILDKILENAEIARKKQVPICQDTGMAIVFLNIGQDVHIEGANIKDAVNEGVRQGYSEGFLRKSVVADPIDRKNTNDNTPAIIHIDITEGDKLEIMIAPKGFGSENMSRIAMFKPSEGIDAVKNFILETVSLASSNPCPPIVVGVGIGGSFEKVAFLAKKALTRDIRQANENPYYADLEAEMLEKINCLGIGPQGFGGLTTALGVNIETYPTHIASLPVAVNISCHVTRHVKKVI